MGKPIAQAKQRELARKMGDLSAMLHNWAQLAASPGFGMQDSDTLKKIHDAAVKLANDLKGNF